MQYRRTGKRERKAFRQAALRFLMIPIFLSVLASVVLSLSAFDRRRQELYRQQQEQAITAMLHYRNYISYVTSIVRRIEVETVEILLDHGNGQTAEALFVTTMLQYPDFSSMRVLTPDGIEALHITRAGGVLHTAPDNMLQDQSSEAYYLETATLDRHQYLFSGLQTDSEPGNTDALVLRISVPLEADERRIGYFAVDIDMRPYMENAPALPGAGRLSGFDDERKRSTVHPGPGNASRRARTAAAKRLRSLPRFGPERGRRLLLPTRHAMHLSVVS